MSFIRPFPALRPTPEYTQAVAAPPYDVVNTAEARHLAAGKPYSFLHISRPEIDLAENVDPYAPQVYQQGLESFNAMLAQGVLRQDAQPCYYLYTLTMGQAGILPLHEQTGLAVAASVAEYNANRIRKHEFTRPDKEDDRVRQIQTLRAQTGPVLLAHPDHAGLNQIFAPYLRQPALFTVLGSDNVSHSLRVIDSPDDIATITQIFAAMPALYIADGHHRSAAAARVAAAYQAANPNHTGAEPYNYFLAVTFPDCQMQIMDYNRVVKDLNGLTPEQLLARLTSCFTVEPRNLAAKPAQQGEIAMYLAGQWYTLTILPHCTPAHDPVAALDVSLLTQHILTPLLGITDLRRDKRIDFVGGIRGLRELERRVNSGEMAVAFAMYPTSLAELMAVADSGQVMPPKSTWFEPKLADGLLSHMLE